MQKLQTPFPSGNIAWWYWEKAAVKHAGQEIISLFWNYRTHYRRGKLCTCYILHLHCDMLLHTWLSFIKDLWNVNSDSKEMGIYSYQWICCSLSNENMANYFKAANTLRLSCKETNLSTSPTMMSSKSNSELSSAGLTHSDTTIWNPYWSLQIH